VVPTPYNDYYDVLLKEYKDTSFGVKAIKECKWLAAYAN
ncbi:MAG: hypothetical protein RIR11_3222, partial [Bacteroidota bacterium]